MNNATATHQAMPSAYCPRRAQAVDLHGILTHGGSGFRAKQHILTFKPCVRAASAIERSGSFVSATTVSRNSRLVSFRPPSSCYLLHQIRFPSNLMEIRSHPSCRNEQTVQNRALTHDPDGRLVWISSVADSETPDASSSLASQDC